MKLNELGPLTGFHTRVPKWKQLKASLPQSQIGNEVLQFVKLNKAQRMLAVDEILRAVKPDLAKSDRQAIIGNWCQESRYLDPIVWEPSSTAAWGLAQWLGSRVVDLKNYCIKKYGPNAPAAYMGDPFTQVEFAFSEPQMGRALKAMANVSSLDAKTVTFASIYEGVAGTSSASTNERIKKAKEVAKVVLA